MAPFQSPRPIVAMSMNTDHGSTEGSVRGGNRLAQLTELPSAHGKITVVRL